MRRSPPTRRTAHRPRRWPPKSRRGRPRLGAIEPDHRGHPAGDAVAAVRIETLRFMIGAVLSAEDRHYSRFRQTLPRELIQICEIPAVRGGTERALSLGVRLHECLAHVLT